MFDGFSRPHFPWKDNSVNVMNTLQRQSKWCNDRRLIHLHTTPADFKEQVNSANCVWHAITVYTRNTHAYLMDLENRTKSFSTTYTFLSKFPSILKLVLLCMIPHF